MNLTRSYLRDFEIVKRDFPEIKMPSHREELFHDFA